MFERQRYLELLYSGDVVGSLSHVSAFAALELRDIVLAFALNRGRTAVTGISIAIVGVIAVFLI